jgi:hypothetical protein
MTKDLVAALARALRANRPTEPKVHFHSGPSGPAPCFEAACVRPHLSIG